MNKGRIIAAAIALAACSGTLVAGHAHAAVQTKSCTDGANRSWKAKAVWGAPYVAADGTTKVSINYVGWTTGAQTLKTQAVVKSYQPNGTLIQTLTRDQGYDYNAGTTWIHRNPLNPLSQPGRTKVTLKVGLHGTADCTVTFVQPPVTVSTAPPPAPAVKAEAAAMHGWGAPFASDEFNYVGAPDSRKWSVYRSAGHANKGLRRPEQWSVNGSYARVTGNSVGTTGGMSFRPDRGSTYGRWEARMRVPQRDTEYHPVLIVWPDAGRVAGNQCQEIDFSESTNDPKVNKFFLHTGCSGEQTIAAKRMDMTQWNNYAVEWTSSRVTGYINGVKWFEETTPSNIPRAPSHLTMQLDWFPDGTSTSTSYMHVDWARAYRL